MVVELVRHGTMDRLGPPGREGNTEKGWGLPVDGGRARPFPWLGACLTKIPAP